MAPHVFAAQRKAYAAFGAEDALSSALPAGPAPTWVLAFEETGISSSSATDLSLPGTIVGGVRIHPFWRDGSSSLPLRQSLARLSLDHEGHAQKIASPSLIRVDEALQAKEGHLVEFAGLWVAKHYRGSTLSKALAARVYAAALRMGARSAVMFTHQYLDDFYGEVGFEPDSSLPIFPFPDARFRSRIFWSDFKMTRACPRFVAAINRQIHAERWRRPIANSDGLASISSRINSNVFYTPHLGECMSASEPNSSLPSETSPFDLGASSIKSERIAPPWLGGKLPASRKDPKNRSMDIVIHEQEGTFGACPWEDADLKPWGPGLSTIGGLSAQSETSLAEGTWIGVQAGTQKAWLAGVRLVCATSSGVAEALGWEEAHGGQTFWLADLAVAPHVSIEDVLPGLLWAAGRRARIAGASMLACAETSTECPIANMLKMDAVGSVLGLQSTAGNGFQIYAARLDQAMHHAWQAACGDIPSSAKRLGVASAFGEEIQETVAGWLGGLRESPFFAAVHLGTLSRAQYVYALSCMHHFVRWTTRLLGGCVAHAHDPALRNHVLRHLQGEVNHEKLIERDLAELGADVGYVTKAMAPPVATQAFMVVQESMIGFHHDPLMMLASPLAAEGVSAHLDQDFQKALRRVVCSWGIEDPSKVCRFIGSHIGVDGGEDGHWAKTVEFVASQIHDESHAQRFLAVLRLAMQAQTRQFASYINDVGILAQKPWGAATSAENGQRSKLRSKANSAPKPQQAGCETAA